MVKEPIAIATSDWHFWHVAPVWRSKEPNWLEAMGRQLKQVMQASYDLNVPVMIGGDIFDHFNPTPETINYLMEKLQGRIFAVPGQHDLEHHVLDHLPKTGFWTLLRGGYIYFNPDKHCWRDEQGRFDIYFAPWGTDISKIEVDTTNTYRTKQILLAHKYVWFDDSTRYGGSTIPAGKLSRFKEVLQKFDFAIFGDNHIPFRAKFGKCQVINCGTMVRRKLDERDYKTGYTVLFDDGSVEFHPFNISEDVNLEIRIGDDEETAELNVSSRKFMQELQAMQDSDIDYRTEVERKVQELDRPDMEKQFTEAFDNYEETKK